MEFLEELTSSERSPRMDTAQEISVFPPHIQEFYKQLLYPSDGESSFYRAVRKIAEETRTAQESNDESILLNAAIEFSRTTKEDLALLLACRVIANKKVSAFFDRNTLAQKLKKVLYDYVSNNTLFMNLINLDETSKRHQFLRLMCDYHLLYQKMMGLQKLLNDTSGKYDYAQQLYQHQRLKADNQRLINSLQEENSRLKMAQGKTIKESKLASLSAALHFRMNNKLQDKLKTLSTEIDRLLETVKELRDENTLLKIQHQRLNLEKITLKKNCELLKEENKELRLQKGALMQENIKLKCEQSMTNSTMKTSLTMDVPLPKIEPLIKYQKEIKIFNTSAMKFDKSMRELSNDIARICHDLESEIDSMVPSF